MAVDPRAKGARAETLIRDSLRTSTGLNWERVPSSGALDPKHGLKGDLYVPNEKNLYAVEVKHYAEDHLTSSILTSKNPQLLVWWQQAARQGTQVNKEPLLLFKYDRSKVFAAFKDIPNEDYMYMYVNDVTTSPFYIATLDEYIKHERPKFIA